LNTKICPTCGDEKLVEAFDERSCQSCVARKAEQASGTKERKAAYNKVWKANNPEKVRCHNNTEKVKESWKAYQNRNQDKIKKRKAEYWERMPTWYKKELNLANVRNKKRAARTKLLHKKTKYLRQSINAALDRATTRVRSVELSEMLATNHRKNGRDCYCTTCKTRSHNRYHMKEGAHTFSRECIYCKLGVKR